MSKHDPSPPAAAEPAEQPEAPQPEASQPEAPQPEAPQPEALPNGGPEAEIERQRARIEDLEEQLLRRAAEFQNYRRRTEADFARAAERGRTEALLPMLDVFDDLRRSLEAAERAEDEGEGGTRFEALLTGVELVYKKFEDTLRGLGVEAIEALGQPFDEALHEAMMRQEVPEAAAGTVVGEIQKGYRMGERVLRHARVIVAG